MTDDAQLQQPIVRFEYEGEWTERDTFRMAFNHGRHLLSEGITLA